MAARSSAKDKAAALANLAGTAKADADAKTPETPETMADTAAEQAEAETEAVQAANAAESDDKATEATTPAPEAPEAPAADAEAEADAEETGEEVVVDFGGKVRARVLFGLYRATVNGRDLKAKRGDLISGSKAFISRGVKLGGLEEV